MTTLLYSTNFDGETTGAQATGWVNKTGTFAVKTNNPVSGTKTYGSTSGADGDVALYTGQSAVADMSLQTSQKISSTSDALVSHILRADAGNTRNYTFVVAQNNSTRIQVTVYRRVSSSYAQVDIVFVTLNGTLAVGGTLNIRSKVVGTALSLSAWTDNGTEPVTPQYSLTDSAVTGAGYPGLYNVGYTSSSTDDVFYYNEAPVATALSFTSAPTTGTAGTPSAVFTVQANGAIGTSVTVTPSDSGGGGTFTPTTITLTSGSTTGSFTYTAASAGAKTISITNTGSLTNPSAVTYTASSASATALTFTTAPTSGPLGATSSNFTVTANGTLSSSVTVTPSDGGGGGSFTPTSLSLSSGTLSASFTYTPATVGNKTISITNTGGLSNPSSVTYQVLALATALTFTTAPTTGAAGTPSAVFTVQANGSLATTVTVTPSDGGAGGSFSPSNFTLSSGSISGTFTYTASTAGIKTISVSNTGSLTNPATVTYTASNGDQTLPTGEVLIDNPALLWSPSNWDTLNVGDFAVSIKTRQTATPGAYLKFKFSGSTSLSITFDTSTLAGFLYPSLVRVVINDLTEQLITLTSSITTQSISTTLNAGTTYNVEVSFFESSGLSGTRYGASAGSTPTNVLRITKLNLAAGATLFVTPAAPNGHGIAFGDSLTEGMLATTDANYPGDRARSYAYYIAEALDSEFGLLAFGGVGWESGGQGGVPPFTTYWNNHSTGRPRSFSSPAWVTNMHGTNGTVQSSTVQAWLMSARAVFGADTWVFQIIPPGGFNKTEIAAGVNAYITATGDTRVKLLDVSDQLPAAGMNKASANYLTTDGIHIRDWVHGVLGSIVAKKMRDAMAGSAASLPAVPVFVPRFFRRGSM